MDKNSLQQHHCAVESLSVGEPLFGTAAHQRYFFCLEYYGKWQAKTIDSIVEPLIRQKIMSWLEAFPLSKLILLRHPERKRQTPLFFCCEQDMYEPERSKMFRHELGSLNDLLELDKEDLFAGEQTHQAIYVLCTHGKRDACCAKLAQPVFRHISGRIAQEEIWQSSHLGGHRFAPTLSVFPAGYSYGRVSNPIMEQIVASEARPNTEILPYFRGRHGLPKPVQAADYYLREKIGASIQYQLLPFSSDSTEFTFLIEDLCYQVAVKSTEIPEKRIMECGGEPKDQIRWVLKSIELI